MENSEPAQPLTDNERNRWPELVYRLIEHYKFEPQHLCKGEGIPTFYERIRRQEVPLNFLFQLLLRWSSSETISQILAPFEVRDLAAESGLRLKFPTDFNFTQPDVWIESDHVRVFIEVKVGAKATTGVAQVQKYLFLHAHLDDIQHRKKRPYLLFLTEGSWRSPLKAPLAEDIQGFLAAATTNATLPKRLVKRAGKLPGKYEGVTRDVEYGAATWNSVGETLNGIGSQWIATGSHDVELRIVDDFLEDLKQRKLWTPAAH